MPNFIEYMRDIVNTKYPAIIAMHNAIIGVNPLGMDGKVDKVAGKGLSANDFTTVQMDKLTALNSALYEKLANKGLAYGYVPLGADGKIDPSFMNSLNLVDIWVVADEASMLAQASAGKGDWAIRSDLNNAAYMLINLPSSTLSNWLPLNFNATVASVNGKTGVVVLVAADVGLGSVDNTADAAKNVLSATKFTTVRNINGIPFDGTADIEILAAATNAAVANTIFTDTDLIGFFGTASGAWRKITGANFKASLKLFTDTLYQAILISGTNIKTINGSSVLGAGDLTVSSPSGVRQTIQSGSVDANGYPNFITAGAGLSVNIAATAKPIKIHAAGGDIDRLVKLLADTTISGLTANALNYCYFDVAADGTITAGATTQTPIYQFTPIRLLQALSSSTKGSNLTLSNGDLTYYNNAATAANANAYSIDKVVNGKFYAEITINGGSSNHIGISTIDSTQSIYFGGVSAGYEYYGSTGQKANNNVYAAYGATFTTGDKIGVGYDTATGQLIFYKNGISQGIAYTLPINTAVYLAVCGGAVGDSATINYGATAFAYLPATYQAWNQNIINGQSVFDISQMKMTVSNGVTALQGWRVFFAEALCGASSVTSVVNYALNGQYDSGLFAVAVNSSYSKTHNLGTGVPFNNITLNISDDASGTNERAWEKLVGAGSTGTYFEVGTRLTTGFKTYTNIAMTSAAGVQATGYARVKAKRSF